VLADAPADGPHGVDPGAGADGAGTRVVVLAIGSDRYAVAATDVREVIAEPLARPVPTAPRTVLGVCNVRGDIVPLLDTAAVLEVQTPEPHTHAVVVRVRDGDAGLSATAVPTFATLGERVGEAHDPGRLGVYRVGEDVVTLLDVQALFAPGSLG
jgi:purine-binding chemotaxis protein CheW